ncbi:hypothetical protein FA09DRAFT_327727 [Tilletiopsis washingtonensis]|uniref:Uncharacterized protein n=1 Tax=Tilletiopsis washingtonensis TaxID=58919 RepID=A0A316ZL26_9BASI|nr:hypothetical protein FA09DRAFT_327727 [Tilletiopsis washingtonensis]PWO01024.1 hypothetical protein FA09DRAFT_327727 [Tilletiopsis washingtonensis]
MPRVRVLARRRLGPYDGLRLRLADLDRPGGAEAPQPLEGKERPFAAVQGEQRQTSSRDSSVEQTQHAASPAPLDDDVFSFSYCASSPCAEPGRLEPVAPAQPSSDTLRPRSPSPAAAIPTQPAAIDSAADAHSSGSSWSSASSSYLSSAPSTPRSALSEHSLHSAQSSRSVPSRSTTPTPLSDHNMLDALLGSIESSERINSRVHKGRAAASRPLRSRSGTDNELDADDLLDDITHGRYAEPATRACSSAPEAPPAPSRAQRSSLSSDQPLAWQRQPARSTTATVAAASIQSSPLPRMQPIAAPRCFPSATAATTAGSALHRLPSLVANAQRRTLAGSEALQVRMRALLDALPPAPRPPLPAANASRPRSAATSGPRRSTGGRFLSAAAKRRGG